MRKIRIIFILLLVCSLSQAQQLKTGVYSGGGGVMYNSLYSNSGTFAQPLSGGTSGTNCLNREGFIYAQQNCVRANITGNQAVCFQDPLDSLISVVTTAESHFSYQWQHLNGTEWQDIVLATSSGYLPGLLAATTSFRLVVNDPGGCGKFITDTVIVAIEPTPVNGTLAKSPADAGVCEGTNVSATFAAGKGGNGVDTVLYRTKAAGSWSAWAAYTSSTVLTTNGKSDVEIMTWREADFCPNPEADTVEWIISPAPQAGHATGGTTVCHGSGSTVLTLEDFVGNVQRWQCSPDGITWTNIPGSANDTLIATNDTVASYYRAVVTSGFCSQELFSDPTLITIATNFHISGYAKYDNNPKTPLNGLKITLKKNGIVQGNPVVTGTNGFYQFTGLVNGTYNILVSSAHPSGQWQTWSGVNNTDYLLALRHATTGPLLPENPPVVRISGDVKNPQPTPVITTADAETIRMAAKYGWGNPPYFQIPKWVFSGLNPTARIDSIPMICENVTRDIRGLCAGDLNGTYLPMNGYKMAEPTIELVNRGTLPINREIIFPVRLAETQNFSHLQLGAITLMLDYDPAIITITGVEMPKNGGDLPYFLTQANVLHIGWASLNPIYLECNEPVMLIHATTSNLKFQVSNDEYGNNEQRIRFTLNDNPISELADGDGNSLVDVKLSIMDAGHFSPLTANDLVIVYPNPVKNLLNVEFVIANSSRCEIKLATMQGVVVSSTIIATAKAGLNKTSIDLSRLTNGAYMLRVQSGEMVRTVKVIVNK